MTNIYALYKGEEFITEGTIKEIAKYHNVKPKSIEFLARPAYKKRIKNGKNRLQLILVEKNIKKDNYML